MTTMELGAHATDQVGAELLVGEEALKEGPVGRLGLKDLLLEGLAKDEQEVVTTVDLCLLDQLVIRRHAVEDVFKDDAIGWPERAAVAGVEIIDDLGELIGHGLRRRQDFAGLGLCWLAA